MSEGSPRVRSVAQSYPIPHGAGFAYDVATAALDEQLRRIEALDSKAGILIAADGVLAGLLFGRSSLITTAPRWLGALVVGLVVLSLLLGLMSFANRRYRRTPRPQAAIRFMAASAIGSGGVSLATCRKPWSRTRASLHARPCRCPWPWRACLALSR